MTTEKGAHSMSEQSEVRDGAGNFVATHGKPNIYECMAAVMAEMQAVGKDSRNEQQGYAFRGIDAFMNALHGPMSKHGVVIAPRVLDVNRDERDRVDANGRIRGVTRIVDLLVEFTFYGPSGDSMRVVTAGEANDTADKATNKAMSAALKYAIMQTFMVPTREMSDGDAEHHEPASRRQIEAAREEAEAQREAEQTCPPREEVMAALDEAAATLGKTRAQLTEKWRKTHDVGAVAKLEDANVVSDVALWRFVLSVQPYVEQARKQQQQSEQQS